MTVGHSQTKTIGWLLVGGAVLLFLPYTALTVVFDYPDILREEAGVILTKFNEGGKPLIWTWFAFAMVGIPLLPAYVLLGQKLETRLPYVRWATNFGVIGLVVQLVGLLRWTFVVPVLAGNFVQGGEARREANVAAFQLIHQFGGVVLGEYLGQLFTIIWTVALSAAFARLKMFPRWVSWLGYLASGIYLLSQTELFATVMPGFPVLGWAGFVGSTLWLVWLMVVGILFLRRKGLEV